MFVKVFFPGEPGAGTAFAVAMRAHPRRLGAAMLLVDFALMAEEAAGVGEALDLLAAELVADVRAGVLVLVFPTRWQISM